MSAHAERGHLVEQGPRGAARDRGQRVRRRAQRFGQLGQAVGPARDQHQLITAAGEFPRDRRADAR